MASNRSTGITTGTIISQPVHKSDNDNSLKQTNSNALLPSNETGNISRDFSVTHTPVRIIAYGLFVGKIHVMRVQPPETSTTSDMCGGIKPGGVSHEKNYMIGCDPVVLCPGQDEIVIDAVGTYRLHYVGDSRHMIHVVKQDEPLSTITSKILGTEDCCNAENTI